MLSNTYVCSLFPGYFRKLGAHYIFDTNFARSLSLLEAEREFLRRYKEKDTNPKSLPMLASACPGISKKYFSINAKSKVFVHKL